MPKRFKRVFRVFGPWQDDREETWLSEMAQSGWQFKSYFPLVYTFERAEPAHYIYKLDYKSTNNTDLDEYLGFFEDAGWEHVDQCAGWHYFRIKAGNKNVPDIYSDTNSKVQKYQGLLRTLLILAICNVGSIASMISMSTSGDPARTVPLAMQVLPIGAFLLLIYSSIRIYYKVELLKKANCYR